MTDLDTSAPAQADTAAGTTDAAASTGSNSAPVNDWTAALPEDTRATVAAKGWKQPGDAVKSYTDLMREYTDVKSKALVPPADDAKPEEWSAFWGKLGRPERADAYQFKLPEGVPEDFPYDGTFAEQYKNMAYEAGLPPKQAQMLHDKYVQFQAQQMAAFREAESKRLTSAHEALVKEWGDPQSPTYQRKQELANRAIRFQGGTELLNELKSIGALDSEGHVRTPNLAKALASTGEALYAENGLFSGVTGKPNPFAPETENEDEQAAIIRDDPDRARALIRQAGVNLKEYVGL